MLTEAGLFLLNALIGFLTFALLLRFYFQAFRVSFRNQIGAFVVQLTNWLVMPLRKVLPGFFGLDLVSLLPAYLLQGCPALPPTHDGWSATCWRAGRHHLVARRFGDAALQYLPFDRCALPAGHSVVGEPLLTVGPAG